MTYYTDLETSSSELYVYEVGLEHFKEILDLSYEMLNDLYSKMGSRHDFAVSLQSYSVVLSHLSKSVHMHHPQIPYLEVPTLESLSTDHVISLEGFGEFIRSVWEKIVEFFRALWRFITRLFGAKSSKDSQEVDKEINKTMDKASQEKEEVKDEIIDKINKHFKVVTPRLIRSKKFVDKNTIDYTTYLDIIEELTIILPNFFKVFENYSKFSNGLLTIYDKVRSEIIAFVNNPNLDSLEKKEYIHPLFMLKDKLKNYSNELFDTYKKENNLEEISLQDLPKEIKNFYNKNIRKITGLEEDSVKIYKVIDLDNINENLTLYLFHYNVEGSAIFSHQFVTKIMLDKNGEIKSKINNEHLSPCKVQVNVDFETFVFKTEKTITKIGNQVVLVTPWIEKAKEYIDRSISKEDEDNLNKDTENIYHAFYNKVLDAISESEDSEVKKAYKEVFKPEAGHSDYEVQIRVINKHREQFRQLLINSKISIWLNLTSVSRAITVNCVNIVELFNKEKGYLNNIVNFGIVEAKKKVAEGKNNS